MPLVERDLEIGLLRGLLVENGNGRGSLSVVSGPVATGKSSIFREVAAEAADRGHLVLNASAFPVEQAVPYGIVNQLLLAAPARERTAEVTAALTDDLPRRVGAQPEDPGADQLLIARLTSALLGLADSAPVLLGVDELQHADTESLRCIVHWAGRLRSAPVMMVLNETSDWAGGDDGLRVAIRRHPECRQLRLRPLTVAGVAALLETEIGHTPAEVVQACFDVTGGNPLLARAVAEDTRSATPDRPPHRSSDLSVGDAYRDGVQACLHAGAPEALAAAKALAVIPGRCEPELVGELAGLEREVAAAALGRLRSAGLVGSNGFRHRAAREVVLRGMSPETRSAWRARAARFLFDQGAPATDVAPLLRTGEIDTPWAVSVLHGAAAEALAENRISAAIDYLNLAHRSCRDEREQAELLMQLVRARWEIDPSTAMHHLGALQDSFARRTLDVNHAGALVRYLAWHGQFAQVESVLDEFDSRSPDGRRHAELADVRAWLDCTFPAQRWNRAREQDVADTSSSSAGQCLRAGTVLDLVLSDGPSRDRVHAARQILQRAGGDSDPESRVLALSALVYSGELRFAEQFGAAQLGCPDIRRSGFWRARVNSIRAEIAVRLGAMESAADLARDALSDLRPAGWGQLVTSPLSSLLRATTELGDHDEAAELIAQPMPDSSVLHNRIGLLFRHARGHFYLATDRPAAARDEFDTCGQLMAEWNCDQPEFVPWRSALAQVYLREGDAPAARTLVKDQLHRLGETSSRTFGHSLQVLAHASDPADRPDLQAMAEQVLTGSADHRHGRDDRPGPGPGVTVLSVVGDRPAIQEPGTRPAPSGVEVLSDAELRVASLAVLGSTNREISRKLFITVSTVEQHLTRIYRKLNVRRRCDLPDDLIDAGRAV